QPAPVWADEELECRLPGLVVHRDVVVCGEGHHLGDLEAVEPVRLEPRLDAVADCAERGRRRSGRGDRTERQHCEQDRGSGEPLSPVHTLDGPPPALTRHPRVHGSTSRRVRTTPGGYGGFSRCLAYPKRV